MPSRNQFLIGAVLLPNNRFGQFHVSLHASQLRLALIKRLPLSLQRIQLPGHRRNPAAKCFGIRFFIQQA